MPRERPSSAVAAPPGPPVALVAPPASAPARAASPGSGRPAERYRRFDAGQLASDVRVAGMLANEARFRALTRAFWISRRDANLLTLVLIVLVAGTAREKVAQAFGIGPTRADALLGPGVARELISEIVGPAARETPWFASPVAFALIAHRSGPTVRRSADAAKARAHAARAAFNRRCGRLIGR